MACFGIGLATELLTGQVILSQIERG